MKKGQKFNSFYDKVVDYQKRKLRLLSKKAEKDKKGKYTKEYKTLLKAKKDIVDKAKDTIDGALTFSEVISYGGLSNARPQWPTTVKLSKDPKLKNYTFKDEKDEIKAILYHQTEEFVLDIFNEKIIERLLNNIFFHSTSKRSLEKIQFIQNHEFENYQISIAKKLVRKSIDELKDHLPIQWKDFLIPKLDEVVAICDMINKSPQEIKSKKIMDQLMQSKRYR